METPYILLKFVAKAFLSAIGGGLLGDFAIDVLPRITKELWSLWPKERNREEQHADLEIVAQATASEIDGSNAEIVQEVAAGKPPEVKQALKAYLDQVPAAIRRSMRRPTDPRGKTVPMSLMPQKADDLLALLPQQLPRFKPGDKPLAADWELVELLGKGGFGEVWKARHISRFSKPPVALKFCLDAAAAHSLRNEVKLHDMLDRVQQQERAQGIVPLLETYLRAEPPCLMYEYVEGGDLTSLIHEMKLQGGLTPEFATKVVAQLASIMAPAHRLVPPLVHRDLKPANILVRRGEDDQPRLFVTDFGIGRLAATQMLQEQATRWSLSNRVLRAAIRGAYTPLYASPQQIEGNDPDPRDDVHALGVIWYQMLVGDLNVLAIPPDWREIVAKRGLKGKYVDLLAACIASEVESRPADAAELAVRLSGIQKEGSAGPDWLDDERDKERPGRGYKGPGVWTFSVPGTERVLAIPCEIKQMQAHQRNARVIVRVADIPVSEEDRRKLIAYWQIRTFTDAEGGEVSYELRWRLRQEVFDIKVRQDVLTPQPGRVTQSTTKTPPQGRSYKGPGTWNFRIPGSDQILPIPCEIKQMQAHQRNALVIVRVSDIPVPDDAKAKLIDFWRTKTFCDAAGAEVPYQLRWRPGQEQKAFDIKVRQDVLVPRDADIGI